MVINVSSAPFQPPEWKNVRREQHVINPQLHFLSLSLFIFCRPPKLQFAELQRRLRQYTGNAKTDPASVLYQ